MNSKVIAWLGTAVVGAAALIGCSNNRPTSSPPSESFLCAVFWEPSQEQSFRVLPELGQYTARSRAMSSCKLWPQPNERTTDLDGKLYLAGDAQGMTAATLLAAAEATLVLPAKLAGVPLFLYNNTLVVTGTRVSYYYPDQTGYGRRSLETFEVDDLTKNKPGGFDSARPKITVTRAHSTTTRVTPTRAPVSTTTPPASTGNKTPAQVTTTRRPAPTTS